MLAWPATTEPRGTQGAMFASLGGILLGLLLGLRHAFEPDHLTAVSTLVVEAHGARRGVLLGTIWGIGHTVSLAIVGTLLLATGQVLSAHAAATFELAVAVMLVLLGARSLVRAVLAGDRGPVVRHRHGDGEHVHPGSDAHVHLVGRAVALWPLIVGLVHGLAGSGAITALVVSELPTLATRIVYLVLFGIGSIAGMAVASGLAGASLRRMAGSPVRRRAFSIATGLLSIGVGIAWAIPELGVI